PSLAQGRFAAPAGPARQEAPQPPLYYAVGALVWRLAPAPPPDDVLQLNPRFDYQPGTSNRNLVFHGQPGEVFPYGGIARTAHLLRLLTIALGTVAVLGVYHLGRLVAPNRPAVALFAAGFVGLNPEFLFLSGTITNDLAI